MKQLALGVSMMIVLLTIGVLSLAWNVVALLLLALLPPLAGRAVGRAAVAYGYRLFWAIASLAGVLRLDARALDRLRGEAGLIIAANHPSMLDALILVARLPRSACIMKAELMRNLFVGAGARLACYIRNEPASRMIRLAVDDLRRGGQLIMFPEGTRTTTQPVGPFRPGVALIAKLAQAPIQSVFIDTDSPYLRKGWPLWRVPPLPIVVSVRLGARFEPSPNPTQLLRQMEQYFAAGLQHHATPAP